MPSVLIIEKEPDVLGLVKNQLSTDVRLDTHTAIDRVFDTPKETTYDLVIWEPPPSKSQHTEQVELLNRLGENWPQTPVIVISNGRDNLPCSIPADNLYYVQRPLDANKLCALIESELENRPRHTSISSEPKSQIPINFEGMLVGSLVMREVIQQIIEAASADITVLITGETGTGKDLVAAAIHKRSKRKEFPYVPVNTGAMTPELIASELFGHEKGSYTGALATREGFFEQADRGTIFLDEISTMDEKAQISLLRVLETNTFRRVGGGKDIGVDVRVIAATNEDLQEAVEQKKFREDLYYRLDVMRIHLPPLRQRPGAVTFLTDHFVVQFNEIYHKNVRAVSPDAYRYLRRYPWPGNVRELKNVIQRAVLISQGKELTRELLPARIRETAEANANPDALPVRIGMSLEAVEKEFIKTTLRFTSGNKKAAASMLGISRRALYNKLQKFGLM
jgi:DNA-binding NtrC family response regulator